MKKRETFNVEKVLLEGSNLIEASAGTGKTFSIAILVLRLIVEKDFNIKQILMVTFTKAAVAELESRIREFIREAYRYVINPDYQLSESQIKKIIDNVPKTIPKKRIEERLKGANLMLDETAIYTIHSFCQKTLSEFAFETHQLFGSDVLDDQSEIVEKSVNEYWREVFTVLEINKIRLLQTAGLSKAILSEVVNKGLRGKTFIYNQNLDIDKSFVKASEQSAKIERVKQRFIDDFNLSNERELSYIEKAGKNASKAFASLHNNPEAFLDKLIEKQNTGYVIKKFGNLLAVALTLVSEKEKLFEITQNILYSYYGQAIEKARAYVIKTKHRLSIMTYDDLIVNLHTAVMGSNQDLLKAELQKKYKAVFIDEFQDTDKLQYEIFDTLFGKSTTLFYIGDPKQAIYSFRGADIATYISAAEHTSNAYTMSNNYRSTPNLINAINQFFPLIENPFADKNIQYEKVACGKTIPELELDGQAVKPIAYLSCKNKSEIAEQTAFRILTLLQKDYRIKGRPLIPSDIGVLVRNKNEGKDIKQQLNKLGVPSVTLDDAKVMESAEARNIFYVLKASLEASNSNINRALLSNLTSLNKNDLLNGDKEQSIVNFKEIAKEWKQKSVLAALSRFYSIYGTKSYVLSQENGERMITNLLQVTELLHKKELEEKLSVNQLLNSLHNILDGGTSSGDEYTQRIESDDDAVKIVTIHKSKGLAYNIVFAPYLDLSSKLSSKYTFVEYKNNKNESCFSLYKTDEEQLLYQTQIEQENRRLIYVALTRAVYKNYIIQNTSGSGGNGSISPFINAISENTFFENIISIDKPDEKYQSNKTIIKKKALTFKRDIKRDWAVLSYSQLSDSHISFSSEKKTTWPSEYDEFVFSDLPKGPVAGNFMHDLFENSDFSSDNFHEVIERISKKYSAIYDENKANDYNSLIENVLNAKYGTEGFKLSELKHSQKLPELEFFFNLSNFSTSKIQKLSTLIDVEVSKITQGMMYGFIDLFFEYKGKYYILDWKSNFLGNHIDDYNNAQIKTAMRGNNYHLQYLIYTVAVKRFLSLKLPKFDYNKHFGGVFYVFLRACRTDKSSGIFYNKPEEELINKLDRLM